MKKDSWGTKTLRYLGIGYIILGCGAIAASYILRVTND